MVEQFYVVRTLNKSGMTRDFVVVKDLLDTFISDMHTEYAYQAFYIFTATVSFNGSIVAGEYIKQI